MRQKATEIAIAQDYFNDQIVPVDVSARRVVASFDTDEFACVDAAAVVLASSEAVRASGLRSMARLVTMCIGGGQGIAAIWERV